MNERYRPQDSPEDSKSNYEEETSADHLILVDRKINEVLSLLAPHSALFSYATRANITCEDGAELKIERTIDHRQSYRIIDTNRCDDPRYNGQSIVVVADTTPLAAESARILVDNDSHTADKQSLHNFLDAQKAPAEVNALLLHIGKLLPAYNEPDSVPVSIAGPDISQILTHFDTLIESQTPQTDYMMDGDFMYKSESIHIRAEGMLDEVNPDNSSLHAFSMNFHSSGEISYKRNEQGIMIRTGTTSRGSCDIDAEYAEQILDLLRHISDNTLEKEVAKFAQQ